MGSETMVWNYRIVRHKKGHFALHEVYYDEDERPFGMTEPIDFVADADEGPEGVINALEAALADAKAMPVLEYDEVLPDDEKQKR